MSIFLVKDRNVIVEKALPLSQGFVSHKIYRIKIALENFETYKKKLTHVDVVLELRGDRDDGRLLCASSLDERLDLVVVVTSRRLADDVDLEIYKF